MSDKPMKKKILTLLVGVSAVIHAYAQQNEGVVHYDHKINLHKRITNEDMRAMVPEFRTTKMQLNINSSESLFKVVEQFNQESEASDGNGNTVRTIFRAPQNEIYRNYDTQRSIELRELAGQKFLIEDTLRRTPWKFTADTKKIQGYDCLKATMINKSNNHPIVAWFTEAIPLSSGPENFGGLPGLILEVDVNDGEHIYTMTKIDFKKLSKEELKTPTGGKKITAAEFTKKRDEFMKEMGGQGGIRIIRN